MDLADPQFTAEFWGWANRIAAVASIVGGVAGVLALLVATFLGLPQLRYIREEQRRLADDLARRPELLVGFMGPDIDEPTPLHQLSLNPIWDEGRDYSRGELLLIQTYNAGQRSARDLFWTFIVEGFPAQTFVTGPFGDSLYPAVQPTTSEPADALKIVPDRDGWIRFVGRMPYLHPGTGQTYGFNIYIPRDMEWFDLIVLVSAADTEYLDFDLKVGIEPVSVQQNVQQPTRPLPPADAAH